MKKVLIIEDDEQISHVYGVKLRKEGIDAIFAVDGEEGFKKIVSEKPDLILLDLMIPKKDGFWILGEMAKNEGLKNIPVLILSNLGQEADKEKAMNLGAKEYLVKADISIKEVIDKIKSYLA